MASPLRARAGRAVAGTRPERTNAPPSRRLPYSGRGRRDGLRVRARRLAREGLMNMQVNERVLALEGAQTERDEDRDLYMILGGFAFFQAVTAAVSVNLFGRISESPGATLAELSR